MRKRFFVFLFLWAAAFFAVGCQTVYQASKGAAQGAKDDWHNLTNSSSGVNGWINKNLW